MTRIALTSTFTAAGPPEASHAVVLRYLLRTGLRLVEDEPGEIVADGGSQLVVRMLGVWFAAPEAYPRRTRITFTATAEGTRVEATIEETLGLALLDRRSRRNYLAAFQAWLTGLGAQLGPALVTSSG